MYPNWTKNIFGFKNISELVYIQIVMLYEVYFMFGPQKWHSHFHHRNLLTAEDGLIDNYWKWRVHGSVVPKDSEIGWSTSWTCEPFMLVKPS